MTRYKYLHGALFSFKGRILAGCGDYIPIILALWEAGSGRPQIPAQPRQRIVCVRSCLNEEKGWKGRDIGNTKAQD